jgi:hypothetical protein
MGQESQAKQPSSTQDSALQSLQALVGEWNFVGTHPQLPGGVRGRATISWLQEGPLLVMVSNPEKPGPPRSTSVIGRDEKDDSYCMLYTDERGVSRIYQMSLNGVVWKMWRDAPGFPQRFTGKISSDRNTITAVWEKSDDAVHWARDLELTYTRVR